MKLVIGFGIIVILATSNIAIAQVYGNYFFGEKYKKYLGLHAKLDIEKGGSHLETLVFSTIPNSASDYDKMEDDITRYKNTVFIIDSIFDFSYKPESKLLKVFRLKDKVGKKSLFYTYNSAISEFHYLLTQYGKGGTEAILENQYKSEIERTVDEFTGEITIRTPYYSLGTFYKIIKKGQVSYYFSTSIRSDDIYHGRGVRILFTDGVQWKRLNELVDVDYADGFDNNVFLRLSQTDLEYFKHKVLKKNRLYIHDKDVDIDEANRFMNLVNVITKMK